MKVFDEFLKKEVVVQDDITPEVGIEMQMDDPEEFEEILSKEEQ